MKKEIKKAFLDFDKEEQWLNEQGQNGLMLLNYYNGTYEFEDVNPTKYLYKIEIPKKQNRSDYYEFLEELGITVVANYAGRVYLRKNENDGAFDFKKEYKKFYMPKNIPEIVTVPKANFIAVRGKGNPNDVGGSYQQAVGVLYAVAYTLKMSYLSNYQIKGFFEYAVPPLEGFWWQEGIEGVDYSDKSEFCWISVIRLPAFITRKDFGWAIETATSKKKMDCSITEFLTIDEGLCVQILHTGPFDSEPATIELMSKYIAVSGYEHDFSDSRFHHEIYLSDPRKTSPDKMKTVIRHPIKRV